MKILVLGHKGMLGHMVCSFLYAQSKYEIVTTNRRFPNWDEEVFEGIEFIIDCIGAIPQKTKDFDINYQIAIWLNENTNCKIIHPATDCEFDNSDYGISKKKGSDYIKNNCKSTKIIQTSIIGPEINSNFSLLEWFLSQKGEVYGYTKAMWNGITTLEWAKQCEVIINNWESSPILTILCSDKNSKYELLKILQECYQKNDVKIIPKELGKDKTLKGDIRIKNIREQILELIKFKK